MRKQNAKMTNNININIQINTNQKKALVSILIFYKVNFRTKNIMNLPSILKKSYNEKGVNSSKNITILRVIYLTTEVKNM